MKPTKSSKSDLNGDGMSKDGVNTLEGLDGLLEKDKNAVQPLIIDGLEVDREVRFTGLDESCCVFRIFICINIGEFYNII